MESSRHSKSTVFVVTTDRFLPVSAISGRKHDRFGHFRAFLFSVSYPWVFFSNLSFVVWNISLALEVLSKPPFEPIETIDIQDQHFYKCGFFWRSEVHAISYEDITFFSDRVVLRVLQGFLAKLVYLISLLSRLQFQLSLSAREAYAIKTVPFRGSRRRLCIPYQEGRTSEVSPATISSWLVHLVRLAYELSGVNISGKV